MDILNTDVIRNSAISHCYAHAHIGWLFIHPQSSPQKSPLICRDVFIEFRSTRRAPHTQSSQCVLRSRAEDPSNLRQPPVRPTDRPTNAHIRGIIMHVCNAVRSGLAYSAVLTRASSPAFLCACASVSISTATCAEVSTSHVAARSSVKLARLASVATRLLDSVPAATRRVRVDVCVCE